VSDGVDATLPPLTVEADLTLRLDDAEATVRSTGERLFVETASVVSAVELLRALPAVERRRLHAALTVADLTLEFRTHHRTVAVLGAGARAGVVSRQLGLAPVELRPASFVSALGAGLSRTVRRLR
jgi:hypothetical protein